MDLADLGVVVLTYGPGGEHVPLLRSLLAQSVPPGSIAVVQNLAAPEEPPAEASPGVTLIRTGGNLGYAGGMNTGIRHHLARSARLLLLLTHDVRLDPGAVGALCRAAETSPRFGVLGPVLLDSAGGEVFSYGGRRSRTGSVEHVRERRPEATGGVAESDWIDGAVLLVRPEVVKRVGLLDEHLFMYFEETDLCLRATRAGWRVGVVLDATAEQSSGQSSRPALHAYLLSRNGFEYARRVAGAVGVLAAVRRALVESWELARSYPRSSRTERTSIRVKLVGIWLGFLHFLGRRFGPPPPSFWRPGLEPRMPLQRDQGAKRS